MKTIQKTLAVALTSAVLTGCMTAGYHEIEHSKGRFKQYGYGFSLVESPDAQHKNSGKLSPQVIKMFTDKIVFDLLNQIDSDSVEHLTVTSLVELDDNLSNTNPLGNQLAEYLKISLNERDFTVSELYTSEGITVTPDGAFIFDRKNKRSKSSQYVLSGYLNYAPDAVNINVSLLDIQNALIMATAVTSMPNYIALNAFPVIEGQNLIIKEN
jgi:TolB-like protein